MKRTLLVVMLAVGAAAVAAAQAGYQSPEELQRLVSQPSEPYILVDVRTAEEFAAGHIPTAVNIPVTVIDTQPPAADKNALIIVYCRSGRRSHAAKELLDELGYLRVVDFGGIDRWTGALEK